MFLIILRISASISIGRYWSGQAIKQYNKKYKNDSKTKLYMHNTLAEVALMKISRKNKQIASMILCSV